MAIPPGAEQSEPSEADEITRELEAVGLDSFEVEAEVKGKGASCVILRFSGPMANKDGRILRRLLAPLNRRPVEVVILDLTGVTQIDSTPLASLLLFAREREPMEYALACALVLRGHVVLDKIKTLGLSPLFEIFGSLEEAEYNLGLSGWPGAKKGREKEKLNLEARVKLVPSKPRTAIVTLTGYVQQREAEYLSWVLRQAGRRGARHLIIDVSGVTYANSPALGVLVGASRIWQENYGECCVALAGPNVRLTSTIRLFGVEKFFVVTGTVAQARDIFKAGEVTRLARPARTLRRPKQRI